MSTDRQAGLGFIEVSGEPFDVGVAMGRFGADAVHGYLIGTRAWASVTAFRGDSRLTDMAKNVEAFFPRCFEELKGLATGLDLPFEDVFAWNCRGDLEVMAPDGCTTVQVPGRRRVIAHNEDGAPGFRGACAMLRADVAGGVGFTAFVYPGSLPGHTFAANDAGIVQAVNNIRALDPGNGLPRMILARAVLDCRTLDDGTDLLRDLPRAGSFHLTLAQVGDPRILSVEFTCSACSVREVTSPGVHANHLVHDDMASIPQLATPSSRSRQRRGEAMIAEGATRGDPLAILCDASDRDLPIRREDPNDPDGENTLATALFSLEGDRLNLTVYDRFDGPARFHIRERLAAVA